MLLPDRVASTHPNGPRDQISTGSTYGNYDRLPSKLRWRSDAPSSNLDHGGADRARRLDIDEQKPAEAISRRGVLKRIGAGAAIAWSTPILTSVRAPAFGAN